MGREIRMVPPGFEHPRKPNGDYIPLRKGPFTKVLAEWDEENAHWAAGEVLDYSTWPERRTFKPRGETPSETYEEYAGKRPLQSDFMPEFEEGTATMLCMYENTSEGTPISPAFSTPEKLARWLAETGASAFGGMTATYEQWLSTCKSGFAPSMVMEVGPAGNKMMSGVEALTSETRITKPAGRAALEGPRPDLKT